MEIVRISNLTVFLDYDELRIFHPIFGLIQRVERVKIMNYIENIVTRYNDTDFIMHFRLSRVIAYELIAKFSMSEVFTSLQGMSILLIRAYHVFLFPFLFVTLYHSFR